MSKYAVTAQMKRYLLQLTAAGRAAATISDAERELRYFRDYLKARSIYDLRKIDRKIITEYRKHILARKDWSMNYRIELLLAVRTFYNWLAEEQRLLLVNPAAALPLPKMTNRRLPPYLSQEQVAALLSAAGADSPAGLRDRAILETLYSTGIRVSECCNLDVNDIDFAEGLIVIRAGKGNKDRVVPVGKLALRYTEQYLRQVRGPGGSPALFRSMSRGERLLPERLRFILRRYCGKAGLSTRVYPHLLRHSFAVHMLENGAGIRYIAAMLGHEHLATTQIYTQVVPLQLKKTHTATHPAERQRGALPNPTPLAVFHKSGASHRSRDPKTGRFVPATIKKSDAA
jgi:integrase/recombinase XerD